MTRRARIILLSTAGLIVGVAAAVVGGIAIVLGTDWGHERIRQLAERQVSAALTPGTRVRIARLDGGVSEAWTATGVVVTDTAGAVVFAAHRISANIHFAEIARGNIHLGLITIDSLQANLVRGANGEWNVGALTTSTSRAAAPPARLPAASPGRRITIDSVEVRDSRARITVPAEQPSQPPIRREVSALHLALGPTTIDPPRSGRGGATSIGALGFVVDHPDLAVVSARGAVRWWPDSLRLDITALRLPGSVATAQGTVAWRPSAPVRVAIDVRADTVDLRDVHRLTRYVPAEGMARAVVAVRTRPNGSVGYDVSALDARSGRARLTGALSVTPGERTELRRVALRVDALDLALLRTIVGDSAVPAAWQGALTGRVVARGGYLDSLVVDTVSATFTDERIGGARSRLMIGGAIDAASDPVRLYGVHVLIDTLVARTLGAAVPAADSVGGSVAGEATIDGTARELRFSGLRLHHVNEGAVSVAVSGAGRVAPNRLGHWLDAELNLDTIALATLARGGTKLPLRGTPHGTVTLRGVGDTLAVSTSLAEGDASLRVSGTTRLNSPRLSAEFSGSVSDLAPRQFVARADIPDARLTGTARISLEDTPTSIDRHVELFLDSTSTIGASHLSRADIRFGIDSTGFHFDTAEVHADTWRLSARGRLAADSTRSDTLWFEGSADSLSALRAIILDSAGAPRFADVTGRVTVDSGRVAGSFQGANLHALVTAERVQVAGDSIARASGVVDLDHLPAHATGTVRGVLSGIVTDAVAIDTATAFASVTDGSRARIDVRAVRNSAATVTAVGDVTWPAGGFEARVDTLMATTGTRWWRLRAPAVVTVQAGGVTVDSARFISDSGATAVATGGVPGKGPIRASVRVEQLGFGELAFLHMLPPDLSGFVTGNLDLTGTRDSPVISAHATLDSIRSDERERPSLSFGMQYANRTATLSAGATIDGRAVLDARGDVPLDLSLRATENRVLDAPISLHLTADSLTLAAFDGLTPNLRGLAGYVDGTVDVGGTLRRPRGTGTLTLADGAFDVQRYGLAARRAIADLRLAGDSVIVRRLRLGDADSPRDSASLTGLIHLTGQDWTGWTAELRSIASNFRVIDDPRLATAKANWNLAVSGALREPHVTGNVVLPYAVFTIGPQRRQRSAIIDSLARTPVGMPNADGVLVTLGSDVRLKSHDANVQLAGAVELFGPLNRPWISGSVQATRGTYRVDLGLLERTFRVDSGSVILEGTPDVPPALDIRASYVVRQPTSDDVNIQVHVYGTTDRPRLDLSSDLGSATSQSEIISYLVFGKPSFAVPANQGAAAQTAYDAVVPSILGGYLESLLSSVLPFFNTLQVTPVGRDNASLSIGTITNPIEGLFNSFAVTGGRQIGTDSFLSVTTGVCTGSTLATTSSSPIWFGTSAEYRPKRSLGAAISIDPGPAPCSRVVSVGDSYQLGFDLLYAWPFGKRP